MLLMAAYPTLYAGDVNCKNGPGIRFLVFLSVRDKEYTDS